MQAFFEILACSLRRASPSFPMLDDAFGVDQICRGRIREDVVALSRLRERYDWIRAILVPCQLAFAGILLAATTSGCDEDDDFPDDRLWESAHFRYHTRNGDDGACEAVLGQLERNFEVVRGYLGFPWPEGRKVDYYKFRDQADYEHNADCPADSASCAGSSAVMSYFTLQEHELVHAYLAPLGSPPRFFLEGIAAAIACYDPFAAVGEIPPWQDVVALPVTDRSGVYTYGAWFAGYLLHHHGVDRFVALYDQLDNESASAEQIAATFASVYGETLDSVWNAAVASGDRIQCVNVWPCNGAALSLDESPQTVAKACDGSDNARTFQLDAETDLVMSNYDVGFHVPVGCDDALLAVSGDYRGELVHPTIARAAAGKYFVRAIGQESSGSIGIRALVDGAYAQDCTEAGPVDLGAEEFTQRDLDLTIPNDGVPRFIKLHIPSDWSFWWARTATLEVEACAGCEDPAGCQPFRGYPSLDADRNVVLRLQAAQPASGYATYAFGYKHVAPAVDGGAPDGGGQVDAD
jgi:hypothetical protein